MTLDHPYRRIICQKCGHIMDVPVWCGDRFCPICSITRSIRLKKRMAHLVANQQKLPGHRYQMWTFSVANCEDLKDGIKHLLASFRKLRNTQYWKNKVTGGAFVIEIKGKPGSWHPHIHAILYTRFLDWKKIFMSWRKCSGGRGCYYSSISSSEAVGYLTKYMTKPDVPDHVINQINWGLKGVRLFAPFGTWHSLNKSFQKPKAACPLCGQTAWSDYDVFLGKCPEPHRKLFELMPRPAPAIERSDTPMLAHLI